VAELRSFIFLSRLQPQTMCYLGTWIRGSLPRSHVAAQVIEIAPGLDNEPLTDVAVKHADVRAGILVVERQFGYRMIGATGRLYLSGSEADVRQAAEAAEDALQGLP
jgi:formylmethanofuran:tetrahydromethanopterin formyltransferase